MNTSRRPFGQFVVIVVLLVSLLAAVPLGGSAQGNSEEAQLCQKDGWKTLQRPDGTTFANQDECVSYAAEGGTLVPVVAKPYIILERYEEAGKCGYTVIGANPAGYTRYWFESIGGNSTVSGYIELPVEPRWVFRHPWLPTGTEYTVTFTVYENRNAEDPKIFVTSATLTFVC